MNDRTPSSARRDVGTSLRAAHFRLDVRSGRWWWSDELYALLGFEVGEVVPSTEMLMAHSLAPYRDVWSEVLHEWPTSPSARSSLVRLVDCDRHVLTAVLAGSAWTEPVGSSAVVVSGHLIDVTGAIRDAASREASDQIAAAARSRRTIEQAKGVVAAASGVDPEQGFNVLRQSSMQHNVPLRVLASAVVQRAAANPPSELRARLAEVLDPDAPSRAATHAPQHDGTHAHQPDSGADVGRPDATQGPDRR